LGEPAPYAVFDQAGRLILSRGQILATDKAAQRLFAGGLYRHPGVIRLSDAQSVDFDAPILDPLEALQVLRRRTRLGLDAMLDGLDEAERFMKHLSADMERLLDRASDAVIGVAHLRRGGKGAASHQLLSGMLCNLLARWLDYPDSRRRSLTLAALTNNVALMPMQDIINQRRNELSDSDRERLRRHSADSVALLRALGVEDELWLDIVLQSHERWDGSGYPQGLEGSRILAEARVLGAVDTYLALIGERAYRTPVSAVQALREINATGGGTDQDILSMFLGRMGLYPPGSCVRLASGEIAVVTARAEERTRWPPTHAIRSAAGKPYAQPVYRDPDHPDSAIMGSVLLADADLPDPRLFWPPA